jgi:hypothetical protein
MPMAGSDLYRWQSGGRPDCPVCARLNGTIQPLDYWRAVVMPGFHPCCDCELVRVTTNEQRMQVPPPLAPGISLETVPSKGKLPRVRPRLPDRPRPEMF